MASEFSEWLSNTEWEATSKATSDLELAVKNLKGEEATMALLLTKTEEMEKSLLKYKRKSQRLRNSSKRMARLIAERDAARGISLE